MATTLTVDECAEFLPLVEGQIDALLDVTHGAGATVVERAVSLAVLQLVGATPLAELFLDELEGRGAAAAGSFAAVAALAPPPLAERATAALTGNPAVMRGGVPDGIGALAVTETLEVRAPGTVIQLLRLERPGDAGWHAASVVIEERPDGTPALVAASLTTAEADGTLADVAGDVTGEPGVTIAPVAVETARGAIETAAVQTAARDVGVGTETAACIPIVGRALGIPADVTCSLAAAGGPSPLALQPDDEEGFSALRDALLERFTRWLGDEDADGMLGFVADVMLGFKFYYGDGDVGRWTEDDVAELMLDHVPRKLDVDAETAAALVPGVTAFLTFLDACGDLSGVPVAELCVVCEELLEPCLEVAGDAS